jgi:SAM-dependent methyltransferase
MNTAENGRIKRYHTERIRKWGITDPRSVGYTSEDSQLARFAVIADLYDGRSSLLDIGCGTGDLLGYLRERYDCFDYVGIDQQPEFIGHARAKYHGERCTFVMGDFSRCALPMSDFVVASGALSYRTEDANFHLECIKRLFAAARKSVIFNMLDASKMFSGEVIVGHDLTAVTAYCRTLALDVSLIADYLPFDFTLMLTKTNIGRQMSSAAAS